MIGCGMQTIKEGQWIQSLIGNKIVGKVKKVYSRDPNYIQMEHWFDEVLVDKRSSMCFIYHITDIKPLKNYSWMQHA